MLTDKELHELFEYRDGQLFWRKDMLANKVAGKPAGSPNSKGYLITGINRKTYLNHRIIFLMHHGYLPKLIDHIDRDRTNNRIENLRSADRSMNALNSKDRVCKSGHRHVYWSEKDQRWYVMRRVNGRATYYGYFKDKNEAIKKAAEVRKCAMQ